MRHAKKQKSMTHSQEKKAYVKKPTGDSDEGFS